MVKIDPHCLTVAKAAADGKLDEQQIIEIFEQIDRRKADLEAQGKTTGRSERARRMAEAEGERAKIAAAMRKRHAALNAIIRDKLDRQIDTLIGDGGLAPHQALRAVLEGINSHAAGSRQSADAAAQGYHANYIGAMLADMQREQPHLVHAMADNKLAADVRREMFELRKDGNPGSTGNKDAAYLAKLFSGYAEFARTEMNRLGASIGKLDGWAGPQVHDDIKMIEAGKDAWVGRILPLLDIERTFPDGLSSADVTRALGDIYDTIITGFDNKKSPREQGQRVNPANLARQLGKSRVLHFKDADAALKYNEDFGYSNVIAGMFSHLRQSAKLAGLMETLGPNPEVMFNALSESLKRRIKADANIPDAQKQKLMGKLNTDAGALRAAIDVATGMSSRPVDVTAAKISSDIRMVQSMSKLGGAVMSALSDTTTAGIASQFRGSGFTKGFAHQWQGILAGRPKQEQAEISYLIGEGFDGIIGHMINTFGAQDGPRGRMASLQERFFRWNGLTWWTDVNRSSAGRMIAAELGMHSGKPYADLDPRFRNVLSQAGIDEVTWDVLGKATLRSANGKPYMTPDRVREIADADLVPLARDRIAAARKASRVDEAKSKDVKDKRQADFDERVAQIMVDTRRQLSVKLAGYIADQTSYGVIKGDARTQRQTTLGQRPGTVAGEAVRFLMQFKGFPMAFTTRVLGRAVYGHRKDAGHLERAAHFGTMMAGLIMAGYASMTAKDIMKGYWPPRNPTDPRTIMAAFQQAGGLGIYGDFLFAQQSRTGGSTLQALAGPTIGSVAQTIDIGLDARDAALTGGEDAFGGARAFSNAWANVPYANLFWMKPALDYLIINSVRESLSPGYLRRQRRNRLRDYGQERIGNLPETLSR